MAHLFLIDRDKFCLVYNSNARINHKKICLHARCEANTNGTVTQEHTTSKRKHLKVIIRLFYRYLIICTNFKILIRV